MNRLRTSIASFFLAASLLVTPSLALAQITPGNSGLQAAARGSGLDSGCSSAGCINDVIGRVINVLLGFLGIVLLCLFLYAGFVWMTAGGDEDRVKTAKRLILNAVIGYFIIGGAYTLTSYVLANLAAVTAPSEAAAPAEPEAPSAP
ncbi:hypothetical protein IT087_00770 [Candidatus Uhrbacteria bacterium]|nr:hypothetical protein [Candidatus Uhrbacteria bacterium]